MSVLYLSLGAAARKTFTGKYPTVEIAEISLKDMMDNCKDNFNIKCNRTSDRFRFLSRKQMHSETLEQFWHSLNGMASEYDFGAQSESLVHNIFIHNMINLAVQEMHCTEPKSTSKEVLQFVIAFGDEPIRQSSHGFTKLEIKVEPVCTVNQRPNCRRCRMECFTMEQ